MRQKDESMREMATGAFQREEMLMRLEDVITTQG